jgi:RNA polymerase sigma factor (sigma-70 family)
MDNGASSYRRFLDGDDNGIVEIIRDYKDGLILFLNRYVHNVHIAEELTEDTFFRIITRKPRFAARYSFKTWLYTIGRNIAINYVKHERRMVDTSAEDLELLSEDEETLEKYGTDAGYRVIVELFSDGIEIDCACAEGKAEMERFAAEGYTVAFETYNDGYVDHNYFTLLATAEQLDSNRFPASEQFGYCVLLYGERMEGNGSSQEDMIIAGDFAGECN